MLQGRKLLSHSEMLGSEFRSAMEHPPREQDFDTRRVQFTAFKTPNHGPEMKAETSQASNRGLLLAKRTE